MDKNELLKGLSKEQLDKYNACKNNKEILELAKKEGIELTDEQLSAVSGGCGETAGACPQCNNTNTSRGWTNLLGDYGHCFNCGHEWSIDVK